MDEASLSKVSFGRRSSAHGHSRMNETDITMHPGTPPRASHEGQGNSPNTTTMNFRQKSREATAASHGSVSRKKTKEPPAGHQAPIKNVFDILRQSSILVGMIANVWGWTNSCTTSFRLCLPGLYRVHVGNEVFVMAGYLLQDTALAPLAMPGGRASPHANVTNSTPHEVVVRHQTAYFSHIIILLKLRWLLRLHSACCELDYKMCSLKNLILGMQYVVLQQFAEAEADSGFDSKVNQSVGAHVNLESVLDDLVDQLHRALGKSWRAFLDFVSTCEPGRAVYGTQMDQSAPQVVSNDAVAAITDTIFIAYFLRSPCKTGGGRLRELYDDLEVLGIPLPELPPLRAAANLRAWAVAKTKPTRKDREKGGSKHAEKLAQLDLVILTHQVELHDREVMAPEEEIAVAPEAPVPTGQTLVDAPPQMDLDIGIGEKPGSAGPPAARVIAEEKPRLANVMFDAAIYAIHHHMTFPEGIRERLFHLVSEEYGLTQEQTEQLGIATTQSIDGARLPEYVLLQMDEREKVRLRDYQVTTNKDTSHLLVGPLVCAPSHKNRPALYTLPSNKPRLLGNAEQTRSLPELRGFSVDSRGREQFKVPLSTGPLTMDPDLKKLRTTGFFIRMPPLK